MLVQMLWGCDPARQLERAWLHKLIGSLLVDEYPWWLREHRPPQWRTQLFPVLVESGLLRLEKSPSKDRLRRQAEDRQRRLLRLREQGPFAVVHLSDEEGLDAVNWYGLIPEGTPIWRNFFHTRLQTLHSRLHCFPIGPRDLFLTRSSDHEVLVRASQRTFPWAFMGTLWPSSSRRLAVSLFLRTLPHGIYFGGKYFGQGLPLEEYRSNLLRSVFALAPEGDRHLDTFRLWESLCCGTIPLLVNHCDKADHLLGANHPIPVFKSWPDALCFAQQQLADQTRLNMLQANIHYWWLQNQVCINKSFIDSLDNAQFYQ